MQTNHWLDWQTHRTYKRLLPRIQHILKKAPDADIFYKRLDQHFPTLFRLLYSLYNLQYDFFYHLEQTLTIAAEMYVARSTELKMRDIQREAEPQWFQSEKMIGGVLYVDLFADNLSNLRKKIPYFQELGLTYLHLMPLFKAPEKNSDGGYAVSDYRTVNPVLGMMKQLAELSAELRQNGISLVVDFVFNHTSDEHEWAQKAIAGDPEYEAYYYLFPDRSLPDGYERNLREIFPEQDPGSFTYREDIQKWVWTTFRRFQWDLNYGNPAVFNAMLGEMLYLANQGVEVLRLDAVAFIWKQMGTMCESLPQAHTIIQAYNTLTRIVAPAMLFKSEAIVHPAHVAQYIGLHESPISYNPTLMALLWEAVATRNISLLRQSMSNYFDLPEGCAWVNYIRVHDDIGWSFANEDAQDLWMNPFDHRLFLNSFYTGEFSGSFAKGVPFNFNPITRDMRISGMAASLVGIEQALELNDALLLDHAIKRLLLMYSVILSAGGIPLIYFGDEIAMLNDYSYRDDPTKAEDSRWVHRPRFDWQRAKQRTDPKTVSGKVFGGVSKLIGIRKQTPAFAGGNALFFDTGNPQVLGYVRSRAILCLGNFSEAVQTVTRDTLAAYMPIDRTARNLINGQQTRIMNDLTLEPYEYVWLDFS